jgi:hypothetical protein
MRILSGSICVVASFLWSVCSAAQLFPTGINYHVPGIDPTSVGAPDRVVAEDFNGDGAMDVAVANRVDNSVSIFLGSGGGTLLEPDTYEVGNGAYHLATGDLNGDGYPDLAVANRFSDDISLMMGHGDGSFSPAVSCCSCDHPEWITIEDFDRDGNLDLAVANIGNQYISIFIGNGNGTFQNEVDYQVTELTSDSPSCIAADDFNHDRILDLAVAHFGRVTIFTGMQNGTFTKGDTYETGGWWGYVSTGDLDSDGAVDLIFTDQGDSYYSIPPILSVLLGNDDCTFQHHVSYDPGQYPGPAAIHDLNEDGHPDVAQTSGGFNGVGVYLGNGDGTLSFADKYVTCGDAKDVVITDLDGDENADLITANGGCDTLTVLKGIGDATFQEAPEFGMDLYAHYLLTEDLNNDGNPDLVAHNPVQESVYVFLGISDGSFLPAATIPVEDLKSKAIGDLNGDGIADLAVGHETARISIRLGNGDGSFQEPHTFKTDWAPSFLDSGDLDQDGDRDLVFTNTKHVEVAIMMGNGDGSFESPTYIQAGNVLRTFEINDFNEDGNLDLAVANHSYYGNLLMFFGNGDGTFESPVLLDLGRNPSIIHCADLNNDGHQDLVILSDVSTSEDDLITVLLGNGDGTFGASQAYPIGKDPTDFVIEDLNGDGHKDLSVTIGYNHTAYQTRSVRVLHGNGDGTFSSGLDYRVPKFPGFLAGGDFDHDGDVDLVTSNLIGGLSTLYNSSIPQNTVTAGIQCVPSAGTVPFSTNVSVYLGNNCLLQDRTMAGRLDLDLADGTVIFGFRSGYSQIQTAGARTYNWSQNIPHIGRVVGVNTFTLTASDITVAPYNQPPYPPSGDSDTDICLVSGFAP